MKSFLGRLGVILIGLSIFGCAEMRGGHWEVFSSTDLYEPLRDEGSLRIGSLKGEISNE